MSVLKYYFDESGNWEELKQQGRKPLVMCAVFFKDDSAFREIEWAFRSICAEYSLTPFEFHAASLDYSILERVYCAINKSLASKNAKVLALRVDPFLLRKTQRAETDLYIDYASYLLFKIAFPDGDPEIYSDMKFRGAYPDAVAKLALDPSFKSHFETFDRLLTTYQPMKETIGGKKNRILRKIKNALERRPARRLNSLKKILEAGSDVDVIKRYEFAELWLDWKEREQVREKYREAILSKLRSARQSLGINVQTSDIKMHFVYKNENNAGIQFADFVCNILYRNYPARQFTGGDLERRIYEKCFVEEEVRL